MVSFFDSLLMSTSLSAIQFGLDALMFINSSTHCSSSAASYFLESAKAQSFKQIKSSIVLGLKLTLFSDTTLPHALKHDSDTAIEAGIDSKSRVIRETIGYND